MRYQAFKLLFPAVPAPTFTSIAPTNGSAAGGTLVTVTISDTTGVTGATIGGLALAGFVVLNATQFQGTTQAHSPGAVDLVVTGTFSGGSVTFAGVFTYDPSLLFDFDFSTLALGPITQANFLAATGLDFSRSTASTVQTSDSTLDETPAVDDACIGNQTAIAANTGLVIQQNTVNELGIAGDASPRNLAVTWAGGSMVCLGGQAESPNLAGNGCSIATGAAGTFSNFGNTATNVARCFSSWQRSVNPAVNGNMNQVDVTAAPPNPANVFVTRAASATWGRLVLPKPNGIQGQFIAVCDARDCTAMGGPAAEARDVYVDYIQLQDGLWASEAIPTGVTERRNDRLSFADASAWVSPTNGQIKAYVKFTPKFADTMPVSWSIVGSGGDEAFYSIWQIDANNYARISAADLKLYVKIAGGAEEVSTNPIAFNQFDVVEYYVAVGNNVASVAKYRLNGGAWVDMVLAAIADVPAPGVVPFGLLHDPGSADNADTSSLPCWLHQVTIYDDGAPAGV